MSGEFIRDRLPDAASYFEGEGLRLAGPGKWKTTRCDWHDGSDSMRVNTETGGWCCMACGVKGGDVLAYQMQAHGQEFIEAARALGAWEESANPRGIRHKPLSFSPRAALELLRFDALHVMVAACNVAQGVVLTEQDRKALVEVASRIQLISEEIVA
jgi:hypothetical protein